MTAVIEKAEAGDPPLPPVPEGAVMVELKIQRFNPEDPDAAGWQSFRVPCLPTDRLLNLLLYVKGYLDGTLTFRRSCAHGVCGSDAHYFHEGRIGPYVVNSPLVLGHEASGRIAAVGDGVDHGDGPPRCGRRRRGRRGTCWPCRRR